MDDEAGLAWLNDALAYAFARGTPELRAYLEAVMDDVLFEIELEAHSRWRRKRFVADRWWPEQG